MSGASNGPHLWVHPVKFGKGPVYTQSGSKASFAEKYTDKIRPANKSPGKLRPGLKRGSLGPLAVPNEGQGNAAARAVEGRPGRHEVGNELMLNQFFFVFEV